MVRLVPDQPEPCIALVLCLYRQLPRTSGRADAHLLSEQVQGGVPSLQGGSHTRPVLMVPPILGLKFEAMAFTVKMVAESVNKYA